MLSHSQEELPHIGDVKGGIGVEDDHVVEVGSDTIEVVDDSLMRLRNHPGAALLP